MNCKILLVGITSTACCITLPPWLRKRIAFQCYNLFPLTLNKLIKVLRSRHLRCVLLFVVSSLEHQYIIIIIWISGFSKH